MAFLLNSQAQGVSGKNEYSTQTPRRGRQCSCIGCISLRPAPKASICKLCLFPRMAGQHILSLLAISKSYFKLHHVCG